MIHIVQKGEIRTRLLSLSFAALFFHCPTSRSYFYPSQQPLSSSSSIRAVTRSTYFASAASYSTFGSGQMTSSLTHRDSSSGIITVTPRNELNQNALVVICHGLGDTAEGFVDVAEDLASQMPHVKFILPTAPTQPVTMNMGMSMPSWYDIVGLDERSNEKCHGIQDSRSTVSAILQAEHESTGLPYHRMVLAGFSQGGALSLFTGMQMPLVEQKLAGILVLSGYLPCAAKFKITNGLEDTPILHCHGKLDPLVHFTMAERSREYVTAQGATKYDLRSYSSVQHSLNVEELQHVTDFLHKVIPADSSIQMKVKDPTEMSVKELKDVIRKAGLTHKSAGMMEKGEFIKLVQDYRAGKL